MAKNKNHKEHHVVPNKKGGWDVKINNAGRRTFHTRKKSTAVKKARAISRKHKSKLVIHNSSGRIATVNSHSTVRRGKPGPKPKKKVTKVKHTKKTPTKTKNLKNKR